MSGATEPTVLARRQGRIGRILLNRPKALNALDIEMVQAMADALASWRDDPAVHAVVVEGAGGRAFCAGGDIRAVRNASLAGRHDEIAAFFTAEYALNQAIADYPIPYIALVDGICMGGGIGVSVHGSARVATEAALFAMPETGIALFPDIGATFILPRLRGQIGLYMALTGARLHGGDAAFAGLATHYTARDTIAGLADALAEHGPAALAGIDIPLDAPIAAHMEAIDPLLRRGQRAGHPPASGSGRHRLGARDSGRDPCGLPQRRAVDVRDRPRRRRPHAAAMPCRGAGPDPARHRASGFPGGRAGDGDRQGPATEMEPGTDRGRGSGFDCTDLRQIGCCKTF